MFATNNDYCVASGWKNYRFFSVVFLLGNNWINEEISLWVYCIRFPNSSYVYVHKYNELSKTMHQNTQNHSKYDSFVYLLLLYTQMYVCEKKRIHKSSFTADIRPGSVVMAFCGRCVHALHLSIDSIRSK